MGCNCGKRSASQMAAQSRQRQLAADAVAPGFSIDNPIVMGEELEGSLMRVRVARKYGPLRSGSAVWIAGTQVEDLLEDGTVVDITAKAQAGRVWMVNGKRYFQYETAKKIGDAIGITPVEVA